MYYKENRYYNTAKVKWGGQQFDSKFESQYAQELDLRKKAGDIKDYETQKTLGLYFNEYWICDYKMDFIIKHNDGTEEFVETKGWATPIFRLKWKVLEAIYGDDPNVKLTIVQQGKKPIRFQRRKFKT